MPAISSLGAAVPALAGLLVALPGALAGQRARRLRAARAAGAEPRQSVLARLVSSDPDDVADVVSLLATLDGARWAALEGDVEALLTRLPGQTHAAVVDVLARKGALARALADTRRRSAARRRHGAEVLGAARTRAAVPDLVHLLSDPEREVRIAAARALGQIRAPEAALPLLERATGPRSVPPGVLSAAVLAIGVGAHEALAAVLRTGNDEQRAAAVEIAGLTRAVGTVDILVGLLHEDHDLLVRLRSARALGRIAAAPALAALLAAVGDDQPRALQVVGARALGDLGAAAAVPRLAELSLAADRRLAATAAAALRRCGSVGVRALHDLAGLEDGVHARAAIALAEPPRRARPRPGASALGPSEHHQAALGRSA